MSSKTRGQIGYEAYAKSTGGRTWDGRSMPTWTEVTEKAPTVAKAWEDAAGAIIDSFEEDYPECD